MFPKTNKDPKNDLQPQAKDENVRKEAQKEGQGSVQPEGNAGAQDLIPLNGGGSNEVNAKLLTQMLREANEDNLLDENGYEDQEIVEVPYNPKPAAGPKAKPLNASDYLNSSHNIVNDNWIERINQNAGNNNIINNIVNENVPAGPNENLPEIGNGGGGNAPAQNIVPQAVNAPAQAEETIQEFYQDPEGPDLDSLDPNNPLNRDMVVEAPKKKKKKSGKKSKRNLIRELDEPKSNLDDLLLDDDLQNVNQDMEPEAGWNFNAQKLPARKKAGWLRRFLTATSYYAGKTIGKVFNYAGNFIYIPLFGKLGKLWRSRTGNKDNKKVTQEKRDHETVPGWNGAKYEKGAGNDEVIADFRRVPTVWSFLTAAKAEDENGKPLPPKVGVYVTQPKEGVDKDVDWMSFGHSGIGIEYSRYSRVTNRYERYMLRYGFYQSGATVSGGILANSANGLVPGRLDDEHDNQYTVSRTFKATAKQVNDILKASEPWADKGYNAATRNCTTFAKAMIRDVAHLPLGSDIFTEDHIRLTNFGNFVYFGSSASTTNAKIGMESQFEKLGQQDDMSYAGFGNKRFTKEDYRQFKESRDDGGTKRVTTADTPNSAAENMRRLEGPYAGTIGSMEFSGTIPKDANGTLQVSLANLKTAINDACGDVATAIQTTMGKTHEQIMGLYEQFPDLFNLYDRISSGSISLSLPDSDDDPEMLRLARSENDRHIGDLNKLLFQYFKNDKRLHLPVMHLISLLNRANLYLDQAYNLADRGEEAGGDLGDIRGDMFRTRYTVNFDNEVSTMMTPSHYESYIQIYKTPEEAIAKYARLQELRGFDNDPNRRLTKAEKKELAKAERIDRLADQFDNSHRYMLEKGSYSQQDVDYAFSLDKKERAEGDVGGNIIEYTAGSVYQSLILEKIFGGMKQRYLENITAENCRDIGAVQAWLEEDMDTCINRKKDDFISVLRAIARTSDNKEQVLLNQEFARLISERYFARVFKQGAADGPLALGPNIIMEALSQMLGNNQSRVKNKITGIFKFVLAEDEYAKSDSLQEIKKK